MIYAADSGNLGIVNSLLKAGAKIDEQSSTENTALICGESERNGDIGLRRLACATRELVFNVFDLDTAAVRGHTAVANRLIEGKASVDIAGEGGSLQCTYTHDQLACPAVSAPLVRECEWLADRCEMNNAAHMVFLCRAEQISSRL